MLPWRRHKLVVEESGKSPGSAALLSCVLRSCPDLLPLHKVFSSRRQKVELNPQEPVYTVRYLGNAVTLQAKGEGCTVDLVTRIWQKSESAGRGTTMKLSLGSYGIRMRGSGGAVHTYLLHRVTYCAGGAGHPRVFSWVYRHQIKNKAVVLRCHAVLVSQAEKARAMEGTLCQVSTNAFSHFKRLQRQSDSRRQQKELWGQAAVPEIPRRRVLNDVCAYHLPAERSRTVRRLSAILEEEEGEDWKETPRITLQHHLCDRDTILELVQDLRRLSIQRALTQKLLYPSRTRLSDWKHPMRTIS
ncbi:protein FAM43B [Hyla sarda]|uniref:protein FAM43B n=1 Tax=Hyla sarda TaxID=327740 RepID=UPI0024C434A4|nr:protein FAM43B [Hyla sarda]